MSYTKRILTIFLVAFFLNIIWENLHSFLYDNYAGSKITELILLRATLADAVMIVVLSLPFILLTSFKKQSWIIIPAGIVVAIVIEWFALGTGRWAYNTLMPIIPIISTGLTPTIQLGLLGYISFEIQEYILRKLNLV